MIVSQFQAWAKTAAPPARADGVSALARAFLYSNLTPEQRLATVRALTTFLDDPSPLVRRALADAFAGAADAPRHIVAALAEDQHSIAAVVLGRSPLFSDAELIDFAVGGSTAAQSAVAARPGLSAVVAGALADVGEEEALVALAENDGADLPPPAIERMVARHGGNSRLREALLARGHLPVAIRIDLVAATASALADLVTGRDWMSSERARRVTREAAQRATVAIAGADELRTSDLEGLAAGLRRSGQLTVAFALRALVSNNHPLFHAIVGDLSGVAPERVAGLVARPDSAGFAALYRRAGLPLPLLPVFRAVLAGAREDNAPATALSPALVKRALAACATSAGRLDALVVLLRRFETEAERDEARLAPPPTVPVQPAAALGRDPPMPAPESAARLAAVRFDEALPLQRAVLMERAVPMAEPEPARFTIDLAAIEAELLAA